MHGFPMSKCGETLSILFLINSQIGPNDGLTVCDDLWMARYLLHCISEQLNIVVSFDAAHFPTGGNRTSLEFSTKSMRSSINGSLTHIKSAVSKLENARADHVTKLRFGGYPGEVARRLNRSADGESLLEVSIPADVSGNGFGHLQYRRVPSNVDPYVALELMVQAICLSD